MTLKLGLPKGHLQGHTATFLERAGFGYADYTQTSRSYRPVSTSFPGLFTKVFQEKDLAVQVALGNYDVAVCGLDWILELLVKYHQEAVIKVRDLGYGRRNLYVAVSRFSKWRSVEEVRGETGPVRIVTEYPNIAEVFALRLRLRNFRILPVWGATDAYPPEHSDLAIVSGFSSRELIARGLVPIARILTGNAWLIANRHSLERKDLSPLLASFGRVSPVAEQDKGLSITELPSTGEFVPGASPNGRVSLALADGHQQGHTAKFLQNVGVKIEGYQAAAGVRASRRPAIDLEGVNVKVVRPQDMPAQVANGNFDLAVTGIDWMLDHKYQFPSSPVRELVKLGFGRVRIVAVVHNDVPAQNSADLRGLLRSGKIPVLRIASEYTHIADKYARDNRLSPYKVIPTWGATEAFLPEDADVLIENTETGQTLAKNNLKIIETLFESTGCLIGNAESSADPAKRERIERVAEIFRKGVSG